MAECRYAKVWWVESGLVRRYGAIGCKVRLAIKVCYAGQTKASSSLNDAVKRTIDFLSKRLRFNVFFSGDWVDLGLNCWIEVLVLRAKQEETRQKRDL